MIVSRQQRAELRSRRNSQKKLEQSNKYYSKVQEGVYNENNENFNQQTKFQPYKQNQQQNYPKISRRQLQEINFNTNQEVGVSDRKISSTYNGFQSSIKKINFNQSGKIIPQYKQSNSYSQQKSTYSTTNHQNNLSITSSLTKYKKMSLDVKITNKKLTSFCVQLPNGIDYRQIYSLNLSQNLIKQILPTVLVPFQYLRELNLQNNQLQKISFPYNKMQLKVVKLSHNKISNLNLEHLKYLERVEAENNKLIFLTLPESVKELYLEKNNLSNIYFIQKCKKLEIFSISCNMIYDLNFNSFYQLDTLLTNKSHYTSQKQKSTCRFNKLQKIQCINNKICHLNGFSNIKNVKQLNLKLNEICLNKQNLNQLFQLQSIQNLNLLQNPIEGLYSVQSSYNFVINKLTSLLTFNEKDKSQWIVENSRQKNISQSQYIDNESPIKQNFVSLENSFQPNSYGFGSQEKNSNLNSNSQQKNKGYVQEDYVQNSDEKPFRLFLDEPEEETDKKVKIKNKSKQQLNQRIYTLGDCQDNHNLDNESQIFKIMTLENQKYSQIDKEPQFKETKQPQNKSPILKNPQLQLKLTKLEQQVLSKSKSKPLPISLLTNPSHLQTPSQTLTTLKLILQLSFIPPRPLKHTSTSQIISKRIEQDQDEFLLFTKLFIKQGGIVYLKKIYLLEENNILFENKEKEEIEKKKYEVKFFVHQSIGAIYKKMLGKNAVLSDVMGQEYGQNVFNSLYHYFNPYPNYFGCYHIAVCYLNQKLPAFQKKNLTPVCYLIQSKKI